MSARKIACWVLLIGVISLGLYWYPKDWWASAFIAGLYDALAAGLIAISLTVLLIDNANEQRGARQLKKRLTWEMGSNDQAFAIRAAKEMRDTGWLTDGSLADADLTLANLEGAQLPGAVLKGAIFTQANLNSANLEDADLRSASLHQVVAGKVNLRRARLGGARFLNAKLHEAILDEVVGADGETGVDMLNSKLAGAKLRNATHRNARLEDCDFLGADFTGCDLTGSLLLRANMRSAILNDVILERADLSELKNWEAITEFRNARIGGVRNAPAGFREWAVANGALEVPTDSVPDARTV